MVHNLQIDSVNKSFGFKNILTDIFLECKTGEIIGILGRNGSGKSTLFKIIFTLETSNYKFIRLDDSILNTRKLIFKNISFLSQSSFIPKSFNVYKSIQLSVEKSKIEKFCDDLNIKASLKKSICDLSTGELRYLEIKIVLFNDSKFCLLDEPFSGLSPIIIEQVSNLLIQNNYKKGIFITDHNYEQIIKIASKIILLKNGKSIPIKNKEQLVEHNYLVKT